MACGIAGCSAEPAIPPAATWAAPETPTMAAAAPPALPWPAGPDCRVTLAEVVALPQTALRRLEPTTAPLMVIVVDGGYALPAAVAATSLRWDLPVPTDGHDGVPCLVLLDRTTTARAAPRRPLAHSVARSSYRHGSRSTANPEHVELRRTMRELEQEDGVDVLPTGDPAVDLIGLVAGGVLDGVDRFRRGRAATQARDALAAIPARLEEAVWEPYTYEVMTVEATRSGVLRAALVDRRLGLGWPIEQAVREARRFGVAAGRNAKDRQLLEDSGDELATTADVTVWEQAGLQPSLAALLRMLADAPGTGVSVDAASLAASWAAAAIRPTDAPPATADAVSDRSTPRPDAGPDADAGSPRPRASSVEQVVSADGVRHYQLVTPVAP